jgi:hypothetical protein
LTPQDNEERFRAIDSSIEEWRQGDCVLSEQWFAHRFLRESPLTAESTDAAEFDVQIVEVDVPGLVVLSQTCDIVRSCRDRPFIEVAPLEEVEADEFGLIEAGHSPRRAVIPGLRDKRLVADLDRVMTVEKSVVAGWGRTPGCVTDAESRRFAFALARKRARFAFPNDFSELVKGLAKRLRHKYEKQSTEGAALRALREIRVRAAPSWQADRIELTFWFIRNDEEQEATLVDWAKLCDAWLGLIAAGGRFETVQGMVITIDDMTARDYIESDPLDVDYLTPFDD